MKLIHGTSFLLASTSASARSNSLPEKENSQPKSVAGLRELQILANSKDRGLLFNDLLSGFGSGIDCGETCDDPDQCTSFMGTPDSSVLEASCDAGCIPQVALSTCDRFCGDEDAAAVSMQRLNILDSAAELMCGNCKFYECCVSDGASYESCKDNLLDMDSLSLDLGGSPDMDSILPGLGGLPDLGELLPDGLDMGDLVPWGTVSSPSDPDSASGLSVLGQMVGSSLDCPCSNTELCESAVMGIGGPGDQILRDACNEGCLPTVSSPSCEDICGNINVPEFMGSVVGMACDSCKFIECCAGDQSQGEKFDACKELLPTMDDLLPAFDWDTTHATEWNFTHWGGSLDWSGIDLASGLSGVVENIHSLFDETMGDFDSFPVTCNSETCPIDGLCDMGIIHVSSVNFEDACKNNTFFECADGLEEMCANECDGVRSDNFLSASFCSLCDVATCCKNKDDDTSFEDCALGALPQEIGDAIEGITDAVEDITFAGALDQMDESEIEDISDLYDFEDSSGSLEDVVSVESSQSEPSESQVAPADDSDSESLDAPADAVEILESSPQNLSPEDSSQDPAVTPVEASSESSESPGTPAEDSDSGQLDSSAAALEVSRFETALDSGSPASGIPVFLAVASIATLVFVAI